MMQTTNTQRDVERPRHSVGRFVRQSEYQRRHLPRRVRYEHTKAQASLIKTMVRAAEHGYLGPRPPWWKRKLLLWSLRYMCPCWLWQHLPNAQITNFDPKKL